MAEKEVKDAEHTEEKEVTAVKSTNKPLIISLIVAGILGVILLVTIISAITVGIFGHHASNRMGMDGSVATNGPRFQGAPERRSGGFGGRSQRADSDTFVSGVVTAINGDTITVSGNGKQVTVTKNSSTTIHGTATSVAVNDSVSITGTTSDGIFTATTIIIRNV